MLRDLSNDWTRIVENRKQCHGCYDDHPDDLVLQVHQIWAKLRDDEVQSIVWNDFEMEGWEFHVSEGAYDELAGDEGDQKAKGN